MSTKNIIIIALLGFVAWIYRDKIKALLGLKKQLPIVLDNLNKVATVSTTSKHP